MLLEGIECGSEARRMMVYHEIGPLDNNFYGKFNRCHLERVTNSPSTEMKMCEYHCAHTQPFQHVFLRIMEGTTSGQITETHLYPSLH